LKEVVFTPGNKAPLYRTSRVEHSPTLPNKSTSAHPFTICLSPVSLPEDRVGAAPGCGGIVGSIRQHRRKGGTAITLRQTLQCLGVQGALKHRKQKKDG
jgi:hypothetical protein